MLLHYANKVQSNENGSGGGNGATSTAIPTVAAETSRHSTESNDSVFVVPFEIHIHTRDKMVDTVWQWLVVALIFFMGAPCSRSSEDTDERPEMLDDLIPEAIVMPNINDPPTCEPGQRIDMNEATPGTICAHMTPGNRRAHVR